MFAALLVAAVPVSATYPHFSDPFSYTVDLPGANRDAHYRDVLVPTPDLPRVCAHRTLFCIGPFPLPDAETLPGDGWFWFMLKETRVHVEYNESRVSETGPWYVATPIGDLPICQLRCYIPIWANATVHTGYMFTWVENEEVVNFMDDVDVNTTALMHPYVRPYDPWYQPGEEERYLPRDAGLIAADYATRALALLP